MSINYEQNEDARYDGLYDGDMQEFADYPKADLSLDLRDPNMDYRADTDHNHLCFDCGMDTRLGHKIWCGV